MKKSVLDDVHPDHSFWVVDGTTLKNMHELLSALENMDEATFKHHVNEERNDFHNWVRDVHKDEKLAQMLSQAIDRESATTVIKRRIYEIQKPNRNKVSGDSKNSGNFSEPEREIGRNLLQNKTQQNIRKKESKNKAEKNPFPLPIDKHSISYRKYELIVTLIAVAFIISLIGVSSQAAQITGAAIGSPQTQEVQFLGLGGVFAVVVLLFAALHAIEKHAKNEVSK